MSRNSWFEFKKFRIEQKDSAMKVGTDGVLLGAWTSVENASQILDLGTGTGLIALMLAQRGEALIDAIEIDEAASREAEYNFNQSPWKERLRIIHQDFIHFAGKPTCRYDLIVSNPPFFTSSLKNQNSRSAIARHDIFLTYEQLLTGANKLLKETGQLSLIIPSDNLDEVRESARLNGFYLKRRCDVITKAGKLPVRILLEFSLTPLFPQKEEIILREETGEYTSTFKELTSSFYLNF